MDIKYEMVPTRDGYGKALLKLIEKDKNIMVLDADVAKSTRTLWVAEKFPDNFIDMGICEQDLVGTSAGFALGGMIPFCTTYCVFLVGRAWDQIRTTVCYSNLNVKFAGAHSGISVGPDGATHQSLEDVALMRVLPNMTVVIPCDSIETEKATIALTKKDGPCFIRFGREAVPVITSEDTPFEIGKAYTIREGGDVAIIANGAMVYEAMVAADELGKHGVSAMVVNLHTVKPLDVGAIVDAAKKTGAVVTAEEHQLIGGTGSAVAECLSQHCPTPMEMVGVRDSFGESGTGAELMKKYGLTSDAIVDAVHKVLLKSNVSG